MREQVVEQVVLYDDIDENKDAEESKSELE